MPRGDGTGPMGLGPMTGRGAGFCAGLAAPGYANSIGCGFGFNRGRGFRRMFYATGFAKVGTLRRQKYKRCIFCIGS